MQTKMQSLIRAQKENLISWRSRKNQSSIQKSTVIILLQKVHVEPKNYASGGKIKRKLLFTCETEGTSKTKTERWWEKTIQ